MRNLFRPLAILLAVMMSLHGIAYAFEFTPGATPAVRTHGARVAASETAYATQATAQPQRAHDSDRCGCPHGRLCCVDAARSWAPAPGHAGCGRSNAGHDGPPRHASRRRSPTSDVTA
ncbi:unnamed protein product (plasmid) [Mycetohabitans rhizoxinica HKI 454]|uniref:Uncharacterized protein n=1 Tax=Mycetohabitans rhizoxinica (strain DSM 19002 / CIP 109453 / HKI 454) TaxID=882378 RepID=E5AVF1_MYCRK|nr:unnamed protein product [Mycetohabitans rhizoxinica HKI 454]